MRESKPLDIHIVSNAALGPYMSGGDRIFIECARRWAAEGNNVTVYVWEEGMEMCRRNGLKGVNYVVWSASRYRRFGFGVCYLMRTLSGIKNAIQTKRRPIGGATIIYSSSDFWPDSIPAYLMRKRLVGAKWVGGFYLFAPNPFKGFTGAHGKGIRMPGLKELLYYIHQKPVYWLIKKSAEMVFVTCEEDREVFIKRGRRPGDVFAVRGGIEAKAALEWSKKNADAPRDYDACFVGRFHPQKGIIELMDIWSKVCEELPAARLAVIGADSEEYRARVLKRIGELGLGKNIDLLGFLDGEGKYGVFRRSKVIVHPAVYDSGGMAACEGMAWGLPAVGFDLPALKSYYPRGMLKAPINDTRAFAALILKLLKDRIIYESTRQDAMSLALEWDWDARADQILEAIKNRISPFQTGESSN